MNTTENTSNTKNLLLSSAVSIIRQKGIDNLTVREVCREAGLSTGAFYHHFPGKDELLAAIISNARSEITNEEKENWLNERPIDFLLSSMISVGVTLSSFGVPFMQEFLSPKNRSLDINYLLQSQSGNVLVNDLIIALTNAFMKGMFREEATDFSFINTVYRELNSIFYGCAFDWALANGSYSLEEHLGKMLRQHLGNYLKPSLLNTTE